jgi:hypothetical protein
LFDIVGILFDKIEELELINVLVLVDIDICDETDIYDRLYSLLFAIIFKSLEVRLIIYSSDSSSLGVK